MMNTLLQYIGPWTESWFDAMWRATWQGGIVLAIVWLLSRRCTFLSPRVVCWMWRLACVKLLVAIVWAMPVDVPVLPPNTASLAPAQAMATNASQLTQLGKVEQYAQNKAASKTHGAIAPAVARVAKIVACFCWLIGVLFSIVIAVRQWSAARRLVRLSVPVRARSLRSLCRQQARRLGLRHLPELRVSRTAACAAIVGIARPTIIFPHDVLATFDDAEIGVMAGHELAHLQRRDLAWNWLPLAVRSLFFFHPLVWLMARGWSETQEAACDELVLDRGIARPVEYGRLLLSLATRPEACLRPSFATAGVFGSSGNLERRILSMTRVKPITRNYLIVAASALVVAAFVSVVPWKLVAQEAKQPAATEPEKKSAENQAGDRRLDMNNLKQIMLANHNFAATDESKAFPPAYIAKNGKPLLSWRVAVLPYLDQKNLYKEFHLDEPWDSDHNKALIAKMPATYKSPHSKLTDGRTVYLTPRGAVTTFPGETGVKLMQITDGLSNTIAVVEVDEDHAIPWTKPDDWQFDADHPKAGLAKEFGGIMVAVDDGSVRLLPNDLDPALLKAMFTIAGGEPVNLSLSAR
jgi:beta-lactamase regulating signal transducer with metallopeptidase domain